MTTYTLPPTSGDPLADAVTELLARLQRVAPQHPILETWGKLFTSQSQLHDPVADRLHGVVGFLIMKQTDYELLELQEKLERLLKPRLYLMNRTVR